MLKIENFIEKKLLSRLQEDCPRHGHLLLTTEDLARSVDMDPEL